MRVLDAGIPLVLPAQCVACGYGGNDRRYVDFGLDLEFYGVVYLCENCMNIWFNEWNSPLIDSYKRDLSSANGKIGELEHERNVLLSAIRAFNLPDPRTVGQFDLPIDLPDEKPKKPRRYPDDFNQSSSKPGPNDVLSFTGE